MNKSLIWRMAGLVAVAVLLGIAWQYDHSGISKFFDVPAMVLVIFVPPLVLLSFSSTLPPVRLIWQRLSEMRSVSNEALLSELESETDLIRRSIGLSPAIKWSDSHTDQMVRYGAKLLTSKYRKEELTYLFQQKLNAEDRLWQRIIDDLGFLAKTAPYNGMLATVMGMLSMLRTLEDFSKITSSVGLALFGTLYGLILFLMVYSPLQKFFTSLRKDARQRNEMIARWFVHIAEKRDPEFISDDFAAHGFDSRQKAININ